MPYQSRWEALGGAQKIAGGISAGYFFTSHYSLLTSSLRYFFSSLHLLSFASSHLHNFSSSHLHSFPSSLPQQCHCADLLMPHFWLDFGAIAGYVGVGRTRTLGAVVVAFPAIFE